VPELAIESLSKGLHKQPHDPRDLQAGFVLGAPQIDWSQEFRLPEPPDDDQFKTESCVAHATSYLHWQLRHLDWSRRDLYSQIFLPQGGAYLRDGPRIVCTAGQADKNEAPDPKPWEYTELAMRSRNGITREEEADGLEAGYYVVNAKNPDSVALAIRTGVGCLIGVQGDNAGWKDLLNPKPPVNADWGHALYAFGFHLHNGVKCIICKSSWCGTGIKEHHIKQNYFDSGNTFDGWTLIPKERLPMVRRFKVNDHGTLGVALIVDGSFDFTVYRAKNEEHYQALLKFYEVPDTAPVITVP
jgi:hypothetical protein